MHKAQHLQADHRQNAGHEIENKAAIKRQADETPNRPFLFQAEDGIRDGHVTGVQTCALPISHRGIETITYVLAGTVAHGDSLGNRGTLGAGDVQWMTAGSGILHQEMPRGDERGRMHGFQLWANLPAALKMTTPRYQDIAARD